MVLVSIHPVTIIKTVKVKFHISDLNSGMSLVSKYTWSLENSNVTSYNNPDVFLKGQTQIVTKLSLNDN